jgi:hypothetical protein
MRQCLGHMTDFEVKLRRKSMFDPLNPATSMLLHQFGMAWINVSANEPLGQAIINRGRTLQLVACSHMAFEHQEIEGWAKRRLSGLRVGARCARLHQYLAMPQCGFRLRK